ncbi:MAG: right-handed parallel beta-helix repeat-containing protein [Bacteroidota bacterium]
MKKITFLFLAFGFSLLTKGQNTTAFDSIRLVSTYESVGVYVYFRSDANANNSATLQWRKTGDPAFNAGMAMSVDRRSNVFLNGVSFSNAANVNQWRGSLIGLKAGTSYEVKVTMADADGVTGTNPQTKSTSTWIESDLIPSNGTNYYVSPTGSDNNPGTLALPFKTIQKGVDAVAAGDIVNVRAGTYPEKVTMSKGGTVNNYVTLRTYNAEVVTIDPPGDNLLRSTVGILIKAPYIRVKGFSIVDNFGGICADANSHHVIIEHNYVTEYGGGYGVKMGGEMSYNTYAPTRAITVQYNHLVPVSEPTDQDYGAVSVHHCAGNHVIRYNKVEYKYKGDGTHGEDCVSSSSNFTYTDNYKDTDIYGNDCWDATDDGIELDGNNVNTRVWDNKIEGANIGFSIAPSAVGPLYIFRNVVHHNIWQWTGSCVGIKFGRSGNGYTFIYHNTFYLPNSAGCVPALIQDYGGGDKGGNIIVKNNIAYFGQREIHTESAAFSDPISLDYNLVYDQDAGMYAKHLGAFYNSFATFKTGTGFETNGILGAPSFVNATSDVAVADFHLLSGSLGIDNALVIPGFNDVNSAWAFTGSAPDRGAYEFGLTTSVSGLPSEYQINIYPNPTSSMVFLQLPYLPSSIREIQVFNALGVFANCEMKEGLNGVILNVDHLAAGLFFVRALPLSGLPIYSGKFIKQ